MVIDMRQFSILVVVTIRLFSCYAATSTELVEEWGCYDSEFKLTCNHVESSVGILEATFTPNCEGSNGKSNKLCLLLIQNYDEGQNSIMKVIAQSLGNKLEKEEEQAARRLLEVLRNARLKEQEQEENEARTSEYRSGNFNTTDMYDLTTSNETEGVPIDYDVSVQSDKKTLRNSLEKLISLYLTKLREDSTPENEIDDETYLREKREVQIPIRRRKLNPGKCRSMRRRIGTLDHHEIEQSLRNFSSSEFNIRKLLNYRCSGKNHCSFIFSNDHPYAMFWEKGTVHIKYICMDAFRMNRYCGEWLDIGNEIWPDVVHDDDTSDGHMSEPIAEARIYQDQNLHQFTNLKIIKADNNETQQPLTSPRGKNLTELKILKVSEKEKSPKNKVYSQDYKVLKILPNELPPMRKEELMFNKNEASEARIETNEIDSIMPTESELETSIASEPFLEIISGVVDPTFSSSGIDNDLITDVNLISPTESVPVVVVEPKDLKENAANQATPGELNTLKKTDTTAIETESNEAEIVFPTDQSFMRNDDKENLRLNLSNGGVLRGSIFETYHFDDSEGIDNHDDYSTELMKTPRPTEYSSRQRSLPSSTLLHGFIANPGYPSFYIGKSIECKWKLKLKEGQSIALTILDLHLRIDDFCKDSLEIIDMDHRKSLYRGCSELSRPVQVKSLSSNVEILLRTKSRSIYPKRGFLIHYKAVGCVLPPLQSRVTLDYYVSEHARFVCQPNHVFPDTSQPTRTLQCLNDSWNDTLVNCVELEAVKGSGPVDLWFTERLRKENTKMANETDMFDDVLLPVFIVSTLFVLNAIVFVVIVRYRKQQRRESFDRELADL